MNIVMYAVPVYINPHLSEHYTGIYEDVYTHIHTHTHTHTHTTDEGVQVLREISKQLELKKKKCSTSTFRVIGWWVFLLFFNITMATVLSSQSVYTFLSGYYLHWLPTVLCGLFGALSVFFVVLNFSGIFMLMSFEANLSEIRTRLRYNELLCRRRSESLSCDRAS